MIKVCTLTEYGDPSQRMAWDGTPNVPKLKNPPKGKIYQNKKQYPQSLHI